MSVIVLLLLLHGLSLLSPSMPPEITNRSCTFCFTSLQAFDMQRDLQITPRRLEYTREKEGELFTSLMAIANRKQEEMKEMIVETLSSMKEQLLEDAANLEFTGKCVNTLDKCHKAGRVSLLWFSRFFISRRILSISTVLSVK